MRIAPVYSVVFDLQNELPGCPFTFEVLEMGTACFISHPPMWTRTVSLQSGSRAGSLASLGYREHKVGPRRRGCQFLFPSSEGTGIRSRNVGMLGCWSAEMLHKPSPPRDQLELGVEMWEL